MLGGRAMLTEERKQSVIELCQELIKRRSYSGEENLVSDALKDFFTAQGFDEVKVDEYGNTIGVIKGKMPGKKIVFDGHMDTVPAQNVEKWTHDPFGAEIEDGKIYGRGTTDMKGALAAMASAAANFAKDTGRNFKGEIYI